MGIFNRIKKSSPRSVRKEKAFAKKTPTKEESAAPVQEKELDQGPSRISASKTVSRLIIRPLITEKATSLEVNRQYVFMVVAKANKSEVKKEVERLFDVKVDSVNIINKRKKKRVWKGKVGFTPGYKKAVVTLVEGNKIELLPH